MDSGDCKCYSAHEFNSRQYLESYFSDEDKMVFEDDGLMFPLKNLQKTFSKGNIKGDILIDLSAGSLVHPLYTACEFFKHIIVLKVSGQCIMELKRWLHTRTGAFNWEHVTKRHKEIEENSDQLQDKEGKVRSAVRHVMRCDLGNENITDPVVLPPADCIISVWLLESISKNHDEYRKCLRKLFGLLKPGGHLILIGSLNMTYYTVGKDRLHALTYDEGFAKEALVGEGFCIDVCKVQERTAVSDLIDYTAMMYILAHRKQD